MSGFSYNGGITPRRRSYGSHCLSQISICQGLYKLAPSSSSFCGYIFNGLHSTHQLQIEDKDKDRDRDRDRDRDSDRDRDRRVTWTAFKQKENPKGDKEEADKQDQCLEGCPQALGEKSLEAQLKMGEETFIANNSN